MQKFFLLRLLLFSFLLGPHLSFGQAPDLGAASTFALFTAVGAFNGDPGTSIVGDIGTNNGAFTPPGFHVGNVHVADPISAQAAADVATAYGYLDGLTCGSVLTTPLGNGQILAPNIYCISTATVLNANLTLDGGGDPGAIFIFQIDGALSTNPGSTITLINGANLCNVYWQINGAFNHNGVNFLGTVIAEGALNFGFGATLLGRGLSTAGAISTSANQIELPVGCLCVLEITCPDPSGGTFECIGDIPAGDADDVTIVSSCGATQVDITETSTGAGCLTSPYILTRMYTVTDDGGFSATCEVTYTTIDDTPPTLTCPTGTSVSCTNNIPAASPASVTGTDNCGGNVTVVLVGDVISAQTCANRYTLTRTYRGTDFCGNSATCAQTITVNDITAPSITCPANVVVSCAASVPAPLPATVTASDLCGGTVTVIHVGDVITNQVCANRFTVTRTYRATDLCGNSTTCAQTITVNDITAPSITCPTNVVVSCAANVPAPAPASVIASDLCGGTVTVIHVGDVTTPGTCPNRFTVTRTYRATDVCGNSVTCAQTITVNDNTAPSITCPANLSVVCASNVPAPLPASVIASDLCGGAVTVVFVGDVITNQVCANRFTLTRTYRATDVCGNSATCAQVITVFDNIAPTFLNPPANVTVECTGIPAVPVPPTATDNCAGIVTVVYLGETQIDGICPILYTLVRTWRATDVCGNSATVSQVVTVLDTTAPEFVDLPVNVVLECDLTTNMDDYQDWLDSHGGATVFDCSTITWTYENSPFQLDTAGCAGTFRRFIRFIATDECGNSSFRDARFTIIDTTPPTFTILPENFEIECWKGEIVDGDLTEWLLDFEVSDNCGAVSTEVVLLSDIQGCGATYTRIYEFRATDECGNTTSVTATFGLVDVLPPVIVSCPAGNVLLTCEFDIPAPDPASVIATDNCGGVTVTVEDIFSYGVGCPYWPLTTAYTYAVTDECGNVSYCYQSFQVVDSIPPTYTGPDTIFVLCVADLPGPGDLTDILAPYFVDNCYNVICVGESVDTTSANSVTYCVNFKDLCVNWAQKVFVTFVATGGCKPLCSAPQSMWGDTGGTIHGMGTTDAIEQLLGKHGAITAGKLGKTISVSSATCLQNMLPGKGHTAQFSPAGNHAFSTANQCNPTSSLLNGDGTLKNIVAANVFALQLNIWYNLDFNDRDLRVQRLSSLPACTVDPLVLSKLDDEHSNVQGLLNLSNDYLAGVGFYPQNFGEPLNSALQNVNGYWQNCQLNDPCPANVISVAGSLKTELQEGLEEAKVQLEASNHAGPLPVKFSSTDTDGYFEFSNAMPLSGNYTLTPTAGNLGHLNGVTTYDLVLISQHILGWTPLNSPYKMIAADANKSESITTFDIVELRKLILGIYNKLPGNAAWRFVDRSFVFPIAENPFSTPFPESITVESMQISHIAEDFVSVKIGDVNGSAHANGLLVQTDDRNAGTLLFDLDDRSVKSGETFDVRLRADQIVQGYQLTLNTEGLEVLEIVGESMSASNFAVFAQEAAMTMSWNLPDGNTAEEAEFTIRFRATQAGQLSKMLSLSSRITKSEAYCKMGNDATDAVGLDIALRFRNESGTAISGASFELYQNVPNPFVDKTTIGFYLPEATNATLTVYDQTGRLVYTQKGDFAKGYNAFAIDQSLMNTTGTLLYKVATATDMGVKKMVQTKL